MHFESFEEKHRGLRPSSLWEQDKADPTKITNTQRIDGALPTIKKACRADCWSA